jgi:fatty-acyl-CoA synthase
MHTGDLAVIDDEGYCNIVGRIKDMVIRGGENIYPREIEEFLYRHPRCRTSRWSASPTRSTARSSAPGSSCARRQRLTEDEVRAFCRGQIAHYKIPRYIRFVDAFPMTVTGKMQKFQIRQLPAPSASSRWARATACRTRSSSSTPIPRSSWCAAWARPG